MLRNVYLEGELGHRFGTGFQVDAPKVQDVLKIVECNNPSFKKYLMDCHEQGVGFEINVADNTLDYAEELLMDLGEGDVTITSIPAGSKSAGAKILTALAIFALMYFTGGLSGGLGATGTGSGWAVTTSAAGVTSLSTGGMIAGMIALNLAMMGVMQAMAPDPATDADQESSYLFNGAQQNIVQGDPVPVLYGKLRVPGQPISFEISGINSRVSSLGYDRNGNSYNTNTRAG